MLLIFGVASLAGSKAGGFSADKWGARMTLIGGMALHAIMLMLLPFVTYSAFGAAAVLIFWSFAAWSSGPAQQYHLATMEPESSGVVIAMCGVLSLASLTSEKPSSEYSAEETKASFLSLRNEAFYLVIFYNFSSLRRLRLRFGLSRQLR